MEYIIYCDESDSEGAYYSDFFGGLLIRSTDLVEVTTSLENKKKELNLDKELKWQRITSNYEQKYIDFITHFFEFVQAGKVKVRIMFRQNSNSPPRYSPEQNENKYFLLYYQFIKNAFGLVHTREADDILVRLYLDKIPDSKEKVERFKNYLVNLNDSHFRNSAVRLDKRQIAEIDSKEHVLAQSVDIVLGSMSFRLNDKHKVKPEGSFRRGKRTIAKEKVYKTVQKEISEVYKNFNIGVSTGVAGDPSNTWVHEYRHWSFVPNGSSHDRSKVKKR